MQSASQLAVQRCETDCDGVRQSLTEGSSWPSARVQFPANVRRPARPILYAHVPRCLYAVVLHHESASGVPALEIGKGLYC